MMLLKKLEAYAKRFDDGFPMFQVGRGKTDEEVIALIDECLEKGKDVYELGLVSDDPDDDY